jgi:hypothetical protein
MAFLAGAGITEVNKHRAYLMNDDGNIINSRAFVCGNDADYLGKAARGRRHQDVELWDGIASSRLHRQEDIVTERPDDADDV